MGMANINDRKTVEREYTQEDHKQYLKTIDDDPDQTFMRVIISIREKAAKDGNFRITHGWQRNRYRKMISLNRIWKPTLTGIVRAITTPLMR